MSLAVSKEEFTGKKASKHRLKLWYPHTQLLIALLIYTGKQQLSFQTKNGMLLCFFKILNPYSFQSI